MIKKISSRLFGFTLTEVMIVFAMIAILATLVIASFNSQVFKGRDSKKKSDLNTIKIAVEEYEKDHDCYPPSSAMLKCGTDTSIAIHPYLNNVPCDPDTGTYYIYETDTGSCPSWFRVYAILQNTKDSSVVTSIGPDKKYNYYVSSDNLSPLGGSESTPELLYGCKGGVCMKFESINDCVSPRYDGCFGQCGTPEAPQNECVTK